MATSPNVVSDNIRAQMAQKRMTQAQLAAALGISQQALSNKLSGQRRITADEVSQIAKALTIDPGELFQPPTAAPDAPTALADSEVA